MTVFKVGTGEAHFFGVLIHQIDECLLAAGDVLGNGHRGIVARGNHNAPLQLGHRYRLSWLNPHQRRTVKYGILGPGISANGDQVIQPQTTQLNLLSQNISSHQFSQARWRQPEVRIVLDQHFAGIEIHQNIGIGVDGRRCRHQTRIGTGVVRSQQIHQDTSQ